MTIKALYLQTQQKRRLSLKSYQPREYKTKARYILDHLSEKGIVSHKQNVFQVRKRTDKGGTEAEGKDKESQGEGEEENNRKGGREEEAATRDEKETREREEETRRDEKKRKGEGEDEAQDEEMIN